MKPRRACAEAYAAAGLAPPRQVIWGESPYEIAQKWARYAGAGESVRHLMIDMVRRRAEAAVDRAVSLTVRTALMEEPRLSRLPAYSSSIDDAVLRACENGAAAPAHAPVQPGQADLVAPVADVSRPAASASSPRQSWARSSTCTTWAACARTPARWPGLWQIAKNASWIIPHEDACWLSERPERLEIDANGRLHCANGPALGYRDGWSAYAWKGVIVPAWIIKRPELINVRNIGTAIDPQVRRCMIEILTPARFVGRRRRLPRVARRDRRAVAAALALGGVGGVEVVNGSPEPDGTFKHYFLQVPATVRSAREGVAWTYGMTEHRYRPAVRT